jgi:hypothetical protein
VRLGLACIEADKATLVTRAAAVVESSTALLGATAEDAYAACIALAARWLVREVTSALPRGPAGFTARKSGASALAAAEAAAPTEKLVGRIRAKGSPAWDRVAETFGGPATGA